MAQLQTAPTHQTQDMNHGQVECINPATEEVISRYDCQSQTDAEAVVDTAHNAFLTWRDTSIEARSKIIDSMGQIITQNKNEIAAMITEQMGKPIEQAKSEVDLCIAICEYTQKHGPAFLQAEHREANAGKGTIVYQPLGVILAMQPWNFPLYQVIRYSIPNILAGNTTVLKHSELCWGTAAKIAEMYTAAGLPEGVFNVVYVNNEIADALVEHKHIKGVTLTGSAEAGKIVAKKAGAHLKKTVLELGGSDPYIILDDANIKSAIAACVNGRINNGGQTCVAAKRFIVSESIFDDFKNKFVQAMENVSYGDPTNVDNQMGPMSSKAGREKLHNQVEESISQGAKCLVGGKIPNKTGYYYPATVLENAKPGMPAYDDELFGPVAVLFKVKNDQEAIKLANDHRYGLGGGVFSENISRAKQVAEQIETGMVNINGYALAQPNMPFGGVKESGYGREHGGFGIREFVNIKSIVVCD